LPGQWQRFTRLDSAYESHPELRAAKSNAPVTYVVRGFTAGGLEKHCYAGRSDGSNKRKASDFHAPDGMN
jgi:hypothetical protein